jgi:hypothetical protein
MAQGSVSPNTAITPDMKNIHTSRREKSHPSDLLETANLMEDPCMGLRGAIGVIT